jgi:hypothetical protein
MNVRIKMEFGDSGYNFIVCQTPYTGPFFSGETNTVNYTSFRTVEYSYSKSDYARAISDADYKWPPVPERLFSINGVRRGT